MSNPKSFKRWIALAMCLVLALGMVIPAAASRYVDDSAISPNGTDLSDRILDAIQKEQLGKLDPNEVIRVSIVLEKASTLEAGYSTAGIASNASAMSYRDGLRAEQATVQTAIERKLGKELDVVWNLTLAANLISANVRCGDIAAIKSVPGVASVYVEKQYSPDVVSVGGGTAEPNMAVAGSVGGSQALWPDDITGKGTLIAIIDTGLDIDHQSFAEDAFLHAVDESKLAITEAMYSDPDFINKLNQLNAIKSEKATVGQLYRNAKVPFGWNYIDSSAEITHNNDSAGEHGSHVAGIAAANRFVKVGNEYKDALATVQVAGNAPDAQIMVMKVFGKSGGAYDSDCAAAIEDAITLGADAVNLSLGMALPGFAAPQDGDPYAEIQDLLANSQTVVVFSAGNAGSWAENTYNGYLYNDGVSYQFDGESGSYTNSFTVASVENGGFIGASFNVNGIEYGFTETSGYGNPPFGKTLDPDETGKTYKFVMVEFAGAGKDAEFTAALPAGTIDKDTIYITWRGGTSFFEKGNAGFKAGAAAVIVGNNQPGAINMDLTGYNGNIPVVSTYQAYADAIWNSVADKKTAGNYQYIEGTLTVNGATAAHGSSLGYYNMSDFSSWGTTGDLALKPEIAAFGGLIYSVWGANKSDDSPQSAHDQYELMSGTSMAAPQITGMSALVQQYLRKENRDLGGASSRAVTMGLLMAAAEPMKDADGKYYSLLQQGAGLANVLNAVSSPVYITMSDRTDGKVKAELGDDVRRANKGEYVVEFDIHNFTDGTYTYDITADTFTQAYFSDSGIGYLDYATRDMDTTVDVKTEGDHVTVTIQLTQSEMDKLAKENPKGAYIEAYVYVQPKAADGGEAPKLSIPVLAYYGNWTDASMYEIGTAEEWYNTNSASRPVGGRYPYTFQGAGSATYNLTMTNVLYTGSAATSLNRNNVLLNGADAGASYSAMAYRFTPIRNYGNGVAQVTDDKGKVLWRSDDFGPSYGVTYYGNAGFWIRANMAGSMYYNLYEDAAIDWAAAIKAAGDDVEEITVSVILAPEYYAQYGYNWDNLTDGDTENGELGEGAILSTTLKLDKIAPEIEDIQVVGENPATRTIVVKLSDNKALKTARLYDESGNSQNFTAAVRRTGYESKTASGTSATVTFNGGDQGNTTGYLYDAIYRLEVEDASGNVAVKRFEVGEAKFTNEPEEIILSDSSISIVKGATYTLTAEVGPYNLSDEAKAVTWSTENPDIATVDDNGVVTAVGKGNTKVIATTVFEGKDGPVTAECEVEVFTLPIVATGVLGDENGYAKFFEWDFEEGILDYDKAEESETIYPQAVTTYEDGTYLTVDGDGSIYVVDGEGNVQDSSEGVYDIFLPYDMDYTEEAGFWWTASGYLLNEPDPLNPDMYGFNLSSYGTFIGLAIDDDYSFDTTYQGSQIHVERTIYLLTTDNMIYEIYLYNGGQGALILSNETDIPATWVGYGGESYSNMVLGSDGNLYASIMTGDTNEVYQLTYWENDSVTEWGYSALYLGNFGDEVWPGLFLKVENKPSEVHYDFDNDGDIDVDDAQALLRAIVRGVDTEYAVEDMDVNGDETINTRDVYDLLVRIEAGEFDTDRAPGAARMASVATSVKAEATDLKSANAFYGSLNSVGAGDADVDSDVHTVVVPVKASDVNNGLFALTYNANVLTYDSNKTTDKALTYVYPNTKDSEIRIGFAGLNKLAADTVVAEITFTYEAAEEDRNTQVTLSVIEDGEKYNESPVEEDVNVDLPGENLVGYTFSGLSTDFFGYVMGSSDYVSYYTWNTVEGVDYKYSPALKMPVVAASINDTKYYVIDYNEDAEQYDMYLVSKIDGHICETLEGWATAEDVVPWDMAYGGDDFYGMWGVYGYYIFTDVATDIPMSEQQLSAWNFQSYGTPYFLGIDVVDEPWVSGANSGDHYVLAIDDTGYIWKLMPYETATGTSASFQRIPYTGMPDLYEDLGWATDEVTGTSLVYGDDGALYFSGIDYNNFTTFVYRLTLEGNTYVGEKIAETEMYEFPALILDAPAHSYGDVTYTWADDYSTVTATVKCEICDNHVVTETVETTYEVVEDPDCTETGLGRYTADTFELFCETSKDVVIPANGHTYGDIELDEDSVVEATCTEPGSYDMVVKCTVCDEELIRTTFETPAIGHAWEVTFKWADDYSSATATRVCANDPEHTETVDAVIEVETTAATCTKDGVTVYTATATFSDDTTATDVAYEYTEATGHSVTSREENVGEASCTVDGSYDLVVYCETCNEVLYTTTITVPATGHTHSEPAVDETTVVEPTCTKEGGYDLITKCTVCDEELSRTHVTVPATGHTHGEPAVDADSVVDATCTKDGGYDLVTKCTVCDEELSRTHVTVPATGHTYGEPAVDADSVVDATCTKDGGYDLVTKCTVCGEELNRTHVTVSATGHTYGEPAVDADSVVDATCTKDGSHDLVVKCTVCGEELSRITITDPATGHTYGEPVFSWSKDGETVTFALTENGMSATATFTCTECDHTETVDADVTGEVKTAATCEEDGTTAYTATVKFNDKTYTDEKEANDIPATGHTYGEPTVVWAADGKTATVTFTCSNDETHAETLEVEATGEVKVEATATEDGTTLYTVTFEFNGEPYTFTTEVQDIPATGTDEPDTSDESSTPSEPDTSDESSTPSEPDTSDESSTPSTPSAAESTDSPETGDSNHVVLWASLILLSLFGLYAIVVIPRKAFDAGR